MLMSINYNLDINNDFELSSNYPNEFKEEQTNTYKSVENQFLCDSFNYLEPEKDLEQICFYPPKPKPKKVFLIEKDKNKDKKFVQDLTLEHKNIFETIKINKVNPSLNQISNYSKEETKENSNKNGKIILVGTNLIGRKTKRPETEKKKDKRERTDNCRTMIVRDFFNKFLVKLKMNLLIKNNGSKLYFEKFPKKLILKATYKKNKSYLKKSLEDFLTDKELSEVDDTDEHFAHNLDMLQKLKDNDDNKNVYEKSGFDKILVKKYRELYQEYLDSDIYKEKKEKLDESNAKEFERVSKNLIKFLEN
jgi:hypothetical protein